MASTQDLEVTASSEGLPRRRAIQGIAGSLAGIAALGSMSASGKKKKKKGKKGTLVRFETATETGSVPIFTLLEPSFTITATCPAAGSNEQVLATGGGYEAEPAAAPLPIEITAVTSQVTGSGDGWEVTYKNATGVPINATTSVVCAYFKTK